MNLNTSHVNVNRIEQSFKEKKLLNLNTSHVNVNRLNAAVARIGTLFKYISC